MEDIENANKDNKNVVCSFKDSTLPSRRKPLESLDPLNVPTLPSNRKPLESLPCQDNVQPRNDESLQKRKEKLRKNPRRRSRSADDVHKLLEEQSEVDSSELSIIKKPAQKTNFMRKLSNRSSSKSQKNEEEILYTDYLFDDDYLEDNYKYMLEYENQYIFKKDFLKNRIEQKHREALIDWLVQFVVISKLDESTMFSAVRMFDKLLISTDLQKEHFGIALLACLWIESKLLDNTMRHFENLIVIETQFRRRDVVRYEKQIIKVLDFQLNFPEPAIFLSYFLKKYSLQQNKTIRCIAMFLLEYFMALPEFSSSAPSLLAFTALYLALRKLQMFEEAKSLRLYFGSHILMNDDFLKKYLSAMYLKVKQALLYKDKYGGIFSKYSTDDKMRASLLF